MYFLLMFLSEQEVPDESKKQQAEQKATVQTAVERAKFCDAAAQSMCYVASLSTRHYIHGGAGEMKRLAAHLAGRSDKLAGMLGPTSSTTTSLTLPASLILTTAPPFTLTAEQCQGVRTGSIQRELTAVQCAFFMGHHSRLAENSPLFRLDKDILINIAKLAFAKLTCEKVHQLMVEHLGLSMDAAEDANPCFKKGVLLGHVVLTDETTLEDVIWCGHCDYCSAPLSVTIADVLDQSACGGIEIEEDGGRGAAVQCKKCKGDIYVTGLCHGQFQFDSGKFHNHCVQCPDFGQCIGDYREAHCKDCGRHWFRGHAGFPCQHCGGGRGHGRKSKSLEDWPPPLPSTFDGVIAGAVAKMRAQLPSLSPKQQSMTKIMLVHMEAREWDATRFRDEIDSGGEVWVAGRAHLVTRMLCRGARVRVHSLQSAEHVACNGCYATLLRYIPEKERWEVKLEQLQTATLALKPVNQEVVQ
jgi:hypothetical protein